MATATAKPGRTVLIVLLIVGAVLAMLLACAGGIGAIAYYAFKSGGEEATHLVDELFGSIETNHDADYYQRRTSDGFRQAASPEVYAQLCELVRTRLGKLESREQESLVMRQNNLDQFLDARFKARFAQGEGRIETVWQRRSGEPWRLHNFVVKSPRLLDAMSSRRCPHCGAQAPLDARFCPHCGKEMEAAEAPQTDAGETVDEADADETANPKEQTTDAPQSS